MKPIFYFLAFLCTIMGSSLSAATYYARLDGDWDQVGTWSTVGVGGISCGCIPGSADDVIIDGYDIIINSGTGNVTVNSLIIRSDQRADGAYLRVEDGMTLTITGDLTFFGNQALFDQSLEVLDNGSKDVIGDDLLIVQATGDDVVIDVENTASILVGDDMDVDKDGGDDVEIRLNENLGTAASFSITDQFTMNLDNYNTTGVHFYLNGTSSLFRVAGNFLLSANTATASNGSVWFDLNAGLLQVVGSMSLTRTSNCGDIFFDMDGGNVMAGSLVVNSSGALFGFNAVSFNVDAASQVNVAGSLTVNMTGGDDFNLLINPLSGTTGQFNVGGDFLINKSSGDDINILVDDDNSVLSVGGNFSITSTGGEETNITVDNDALFSVGGHFVINHTAGQAITLSLEGGTDLPELLVAGNCSLTCAGGADNLQLSVAGGTFAVAGNCSFNLGSGAGNFLVNLDGASLFSVAGDFTATLAGGNDMLFGLGELTAASTAKLDVGGHLQLIHNFNDAAALFHMHIYDDTEVEAAQLTVSQNFTAPALFAVEVANTALLDVDGNINISAAGSGEVEIDVGSGAALELMGNIVRAASPNKFGTVDFSGGGTIYYNGSSSQFFAQDAGSGTDLISYYNVVINNSGATNPQITMEGLATVRNNITFIDGVIASTSSNLLVVADNAVSSGQSSGSHVDGPVRKIGNESFTFPVGDLNNYQAITISAPALATDAFEAQYFNVDPHPTYNDASKVAAIDHISSCEYWTLNRVSGASNVSVTLTWDGNSCGVDNMSQLLVARWDGSQWVSHGNGGTTGVNPFGTIVTSGVVSAFSPFTLASSTSANILPVQLLYFQAKAGLTNVDLSWATMEESNASHFLVERSSNGLSWQQVASIGAAGTSQTRNSYLITDNKPVRPLSYYRLTQFDLDGSAVSYPVVVVNFNDESDVRVFPNPAEDVLFVKGTDIRSLTLIDNLGQQVPMIWEHNEDGAELRVQGLQSGLYHLRIGRPGTPMWRTVTIR